jgi:hypothetical protein
MERWTIKPPYVFVLLSLLFLIALILILPQVDLPDTAFNRGTAPVDVHVRSISAPGLLSVGPVVSFDFPSQTTSGRHEQYVRSGHVTSSSLPLLHRSLRC